MYYSIAHLLVQSKLDIIHLLTRAIYICYNCEFHLPCNHHKQVLFIKIMTGLMAYACRSHDFTSFYGSMGYKTLELYSITFHEMSLSFTCFLPTHWYCYK